MPAGLPEFAGGGGEDAETLDTVTIPTLPTVRDLPLDEAAQHLTTMQVVVEPLLFRRYRVLRELGRGGMGVVSLAHDQVLGIPVAMKLVPEEVARSEEDLEGLRKEVLRGIALTHSGIVRVFSFEREANSAAIVMEYVDGESLADLKARQPGRCFEAEQLRPWLEQLCAVLDYAHGEAKIAHRDLKPRNLMLTRDGRLKVADFGIASSLSETMAGVSIRSDSSGTPPYMSPQQAMGERPTGADDIYALGATLYDLLTSKPPFFRGNIIAQVLQEQPAPMEQRRAELEIAGKAPIPASWERAIAACLAKDPSARPPSGAALLQLLDVAPDAMVPYVARLCVPLGTLRLDAVVSEPEILEARAIHRAAPVVPASRWKQAILPALWSGVRTVFGGVAEVLAFLRDEAIAWTRRIVYTATAIAAGLAVLYVVQRMPSAPSAVAAPRAAESAPAAAPQVIVVQAPPPQPPPGWMPPPGGFPMPPPPPPPPPGPGRR